MEEYDDLAKGPNEDGKLNLSYSDFQTIPYEICNEYSKSLISLNLSYNNLTVISEHIGKLTLLKELDLSHNRIATINKSMGQCIRLRTLDLSHNHIASVPTEIFQCCKLLVSKLALEDFIISITLHIQSSWCFFQGYYWLQ